MADLTDTAAAPSSPGPVLRVRGLTKSYGALRVVDDVSFDVNAGEVLTLLGPSGCGKSTTLRMIAGLDQPDAGEVWVRGRLMASPANNIMVPPEGRKVGLVFQSYAIWPHMTVEENIGVPAEGPSPRSRYDREQGCRDHSAREARWTWRTHAHGAERRTAAARCARARARLRAGSPPARRAAEQPRLGPAKGDAAPDQAAAVAARDHRPLRHARPGGGDGAVEPGCRDEPRAHRTDRSAGGGLRAAVDAVRAGFRRRDDPFARLDCRRGAAAANSDRRMHDRGGRRTVRLCVPAARSRSRCDPRTCGCMPAPLPRKMDSRGTSST